MTSKLFTPITLGGVELSNRVVLSPMCQYTAREGTVGDWHVMHLGQFAVAGAGLVIVEASGVEAGFALVVDCDSGKLAYELLKQSDLYVCAVFDDAAKAEKAREAFARANLHCYRISILHRRPGTKLHCFRSRCGKPRRPAEPRDRVFPARALRA